MAVIASGTTSLVPLGRFPCPQKPMRDMTGRSWSRAAAAAGMHLLPLLAMAALLQLPPPCRGQMETPLKGQGIPGNSTTEVFLSVYLDRLLLVDDRNYRHEAVFYFYLTWRDPAAYDTVRASTDCMLAGTCDCKKPCSDWVGNQSCCDGLYQPTFFFRNAFAFPQDRATGYKLYAVPPPAGSVLWTQFVHGIFYQPMDLRHFPFDSWDLLVMLEFVDTTPPDRPGLSVRLSSGSTELYTFGKGDPVSQWHVDSISTALMPVSDPVAYFKNHSTLPSAPNDPLGLTNSNAATLRGSPPGATRMQDSRNVTRVVVKVKISRFWRYQLFNSVLPVVLLGWLAFVVFFLERRDLATRLGVVVTLFLAMAAVQFVIAGDQPASSYVLPTQQTVIATYVLLALIAIESIVVYHVETWKETTEAARQRRQARDRYLASRKARQAARAAEVRAAAAEAEAEAKRRESALSMKQPTQEWQQAQEVAVQLADSAAEAAADAMAASAGSTACNSVDTAHCSQGGAAGAGVGAGAGSQRGDGGGHMPLIAGGGAAGAAAARKLTRMQSLCIDQAYDAYCAYVVDRTALAILLVLYDLTVALIFVLQSGYIDMFGS